MSTATDTAISSSEARHRPRTHKPRGICRYYQTLQGCFSGDKCKFLHGKDHTESQVNAPAPSGSGSERQLLTPYDRAKACRFYANGFCKRGDSCWFQHVSAGGGTSSPGPASSDKGKQSAPPVDEDSDSDHLLCSICLEKPVTFGLLGGCSHIFCISCIRQWRDPAQKHADVVESGNTKKCPMCRTPSHFITPSSVYVQHGTPEKERVVQKYKESMARVPCKYFEKTKADGVPMCPFGKDCFYKHEKADGTPHVFEEGASFWLKKYALETRRRSPFSTRNLRWMFDEDSDDDFGGFPFPFQLNPFHILDLVGPLNRAFEERVAGSGNGNAEGDEGNRLLQSDNFVQLARTLQSFRDSFQSADANENDGAERRTTRRQRNNRGDADRRENEAIERLGILADQVLTSITVLQQHQGQEVQDRGNTPPPPLEPIGTLGGLPSTATLDGRLRIDVDENENSMPELQSISNSSEDDYNDSESDSDDDFYGSDANEHDESDDGLPTLDWVTGTQTEGLALEQALTGLGFGLPAFDGSGRPLPAEDDLPDLEPIGAGEPSTQRSTPMEHTLSTNSPESVSTLLSLAPPIQPDPSTSSSTSSLNPDPPFVTDGRGRVVWTSSPQENVSQPASDSPSPAITAAVDSPDPSPPGAMPLPSSSSGSKALPPVVDTATRPTSAGFTTDGRGRVIGTGVSNGSDVERAGAASGTNSPAQRGMIGRMINAFVGSFIGDDVPGVPP